MSDNQPTMYQPPAQTQAPQNQNEATVVVHNPSIGALITTGVVSSVVAISATLLYLHFFPQTKPVVHPIAIVDVVKMSAEVTKAAATGAQAEEMLLVAGDRMQELKRRGYIVMDARNIIFAPDRYIVKTSELIPGASDEAVFGSGYAAPNLTLKPLPTQGGNK